MPDRFPEGTWLLLDAAGPHSVAGLVRDGQWQARESHEGEFLEWFQPAIQRLLQKETLALADLAGALYAAGPGSTLGLRLAAMFIRSLMTLPGTAHWTCYQYQNLEVALAVIAESGQGAIPEAVAPWRRDRLHHSQLLGQTPLQFANAHLSPEEAASRTLSGFVLGRRPQNMPQGIDWNPFPIDRIPAILTAYPHLLQATAFPAPYLAEDPEFARWSPQRHSAK